MQSRNQQQKQQKYLEVSFGPLKFVNIKLFTVMKSINMADYRHENSSVRMICRTAK